MIRPPPDALLRRLESLETPPPPNPITVYSTRLDRLKKGLSREDAEIAERLEKLQGWEQLHCRIVIWTTYFKYNALFELPKIHIVNTICSYKEYNVLCKSN